MSWMVDEIRECGGAVPFDRFMEMALYHPRHGYYSTDTPRFGRSADFLTAPTASEWYPRVVARLLRFAAPVLGPFRFVDLAAGDGCMLRGVEAALRDGVSAVVGEAVAVERSEAMARRISSQPSRIPLIRAADLTEVSIGSQTAVIHASELYDAQPVVRVVKRQGEVQELWVAEGPEESLEWRELQARPEVVAYFDGHGVVLEEGQIAEANLQAREFHRRVLETAGGDGLVLVLDYGYEAARLYNPRGRRSGSLATFSNHRVGRDPLQSPGEIDLTAHVNWDDLRSAASSSGWQEIGLWSLAEFLVRAGIADELEAWGFGMDAELDGATFTARQE